MFLLIFFFLITGIYFLILVFTAQLVNPIEELVIPIGIPSKEAKPEIETNPVTAATKIRKVFNAI